MSDKKISELTALTGANVADTDLLPIVDTSATETKKITFGEFKTALDTATGFVRITGDTMTGALDVQSTITATGTSVFASLDISGDIDVDGTTNLDVVDIDGAVDMASTLAVAGAATFDGKVRVGTSVDGVAALMTFDSALNYSSLQMGNNSGTGSAGGVLLYSSSVNDFAIYQYTGAVGSETYGGPTFALNSLGGPTFTPAANGHAVFNGGGIDADFRVESVTTANALFVEGSSGNVGIGTSSPDVFNRSYTGTTTGISSASGETALMLNSSGTNVTALEMGRAGTRELMLYDTSTTSQLYTLVSKPFIFGTNSTERMRITSTGACEWRPDGTTQAMTLDASGNLLVGKTSGPNYNVVGVDITHLGEGQFTVSSNPVLQLNRQTSDGDIAVFRKDGTTVGSIGNSGGSMYISAASTGGLKYTYLNGTNAVTQPCNTTGATTNGTHDLGSSGAKFRDLYLSGGVVFGDAGGSGTPTANTLDSYEEGTWVPTLYGSGSSATTLLTALGRYVKVGKSVTCWIEIACDGSTTLPTGNYISLAGLPFSPVASRAFAAVVSVTGLTGLTAGTYFVGIIYSGTIVNLNKMNQDGVIGTAGLTAASLTSTFGATTSITYEAS